MSEILTHEMALTQGDSQVFSSQLLLRKMLTAFTVSPPATSDWRPVSLWDGKKSQQSFVIRRNEWLR